MTRDGKARLGILMLQSRFPRIPGDIGNPVTWPFRVTLRVVEDASPHRVVREGADGLLDAFCEAACDLVTDGVDGITTTCGFLSLFQDEIAARCRVPVASWTASSGAPHSWRRRTSATSSARTPPSDALR